jgi:hypothetical protein
MKEKDRDKLNALVLGTLIGTSLIADSLVRNGVIERSELVAPLSEAESLATDERRQAYPCCGSLSREDMKANRRKARMIPRFGFGPICARIPVVAAQGHLPPDCSFAATRPWA